MSYSISIGHFPLVLVTLDYVMLPQLYQYQYINISIYPYIIFLSLTGPSWLPYWSYSIDIYIHTYPIYLSPPPLKRADLLIFCFGFFHFPFFFTYSDYHQSFITSPLGSIYFPTLSPECNQPFFLLKLVSTSFHDYQTIFLFSYSKYRLILLSII